MSIRTVTDERGVRTPRSSLRDIWKGERKIPLDGASLIWGLAILLVVGCGGEPPGYPDHLKYATREDRIVIRVPTIQVDQLEPAGELDAHLAQIDAKGGQTFDPKTLSKETRNRIRETLLPLFGTPAEPRVTGNASIDSEATILGLRPEALAHGSIVFRRHCQQCHGVQGDGRGPTGLWIQPHPRDFRSGKLKYVTTSAGTGKPAIEDLRRTLRNGLKGTSMPSFAQMTDDDRENVIRYLIHLSLRGQVERQLLLDLMEEEVSDLKPRAESLLGKYLGEWNLSMSASASGHPSSNRGAEFTDDKQDQEAIRRGYSLFTDPNGAGCVKCHTDFGRQAKYHYDVWGTLVKPMDLTQNVYRGGNTPENQYHRIRLGILPSGMPSSEKLSEDQIWDLVHFVRALPFPNKLPQDVRKRIYPE